MPLRGTALERLRSATHVLTSIPPIADMDLDPVLAYHSADLLRTGSPLRWAGYLSTTGVYGDHGGSWGDEDRCRRRRRACGLRLLLLLVVLVVTVVVVVGGGGGGGGNATTTTTTTTTIINI